MPSKDRIPKGKIRIFSYITIDNRQFLAEKAKEFGMSESKLLDVILDQVRESRSKFKIVQIVKI